MPDPLEQCSDCAPSQAQHTFEKTIYRLRVVVSSNELSFIRWLGYHLSGDDRAPLTGTTGSEISFTARYHVHIGNAEAGDGSMHRIFGEEDPVVHCRSWGHLQAHMERAITRAVRRHIAPYHVVHAGAIACNGRGVLLPGNSGSGKSTLVAALAFGGFEYYTDEVTVLTQEGRLLPYPKAITIKLGGWEALTARYPQVASAAYAPVHHHQLRHLAAPNLPPPSSMETGSRIDFFVFPRYAPGQRASLTPVSRATAMARMAERSLNLFLLGKDGLDVIYSVVRQVQCLDLRFDDLDEAVLLLKSLVSSGQAGTPEAANGVKPIARELSSVHRSELAQMR